MIHLLMSTAFAGFGGAELAVIGESDSAGVELLLSAEVTPWTTGTEKLTLDWARAGIDWGALTLDERFDGLEVEALAGSASFGSGSTGASFGAGQVIWDPELGFVEIGVVSGGMGGTLLNHRLRWGVGGDLHGRIQKENSLYLGLPLQVGYTQPLANRPFLDVGLVLRPSFGLVGDQLGAFDGRLTAEAGVHAVDEEEAKLDVVLAYAGQLDTATDAGRQTVNRLGIGARARF
ncbi:MAG TPA: hypothetical protein QGF58_16680 [Myxococcota bacterium]|nr:hypothetical protein [Myxococcota bacterium]